MEKLLLKCLNYIIFFKLCHVLDFIGGNQAQKQSFFGYCFKTKRLLKRRVYIAYKKIYVANCRTIFKPSIKIEPIYS